MSVVFSVKIRRELREEMEKYWKIVNWAEEVRKFLEKKVRELEAEENFKKALSTDWSVLKGFEAFSVGKDHDSG